MRFSLRWAPFLHLAIFASLAGPALAASLDDALAAYKKSDFAGAASLFTQLAEGGDPQAQHNVGYLYHVGKGVARDDARAMIWYRKAADRGYAPSQFNVGVMFEDGRSVGPDVDRAIAWYTKAADQGDPGEQFNLGSFYFNVWAAPKDDARARLWYSKAAAQGSKAAEAVLKKMPRAATSRRRGSIPRRRASKRS